MNFSPPGPISGAFTAASVLLAFQLAQSLVLQILFHVSARRFCDRWCFLARQFPGSRVNLLAAQLFFQEPIVTAEDSRHGRYGLTPQAHPRWIHFEGCPSQGRLVKLGVSQSNVQCGTGQLTYVQGCVYRGVLCCGVLWCVCRDLNFLSGLPQRPR